IGLLEAAASRRFGDAIAAGDWLEQPHGALGGRSPRSAAADVEGYEKAISLLQGPQAVVAQRASNGGCTERATAAAAWAPAASRALPPPAEATAGQRWHDVKQHRQSEAPD